MERRGRLHWSLTRVLLHSGTPSLPSPFSCKQLALASDPYQNPGLALSAPFHYVPLQRRLALARYSHHPSVDSPCADISRAAHATGLVGVLALVAEVAQGLCDRLRGFEPRAHEVPAIQTSVCCCLLSRRFKRAQHDHRGGSIEAAISCFATALRRRCGGGLSAVTTS